MQETQPSDNESFPVDPSEDLNPTSWKKVALAMGGVFLSFIAIDVAVPQFWMQPSGSGFVMTIFLSLAVAQLTLICVWGTLVEGTFWIHLPWTILMLVVSWAALALGVHIEDGDLTATNVMGLGIVWLYGFVISFVPLKIAAIFFRWRITRHGESSYRSHKFAIRDMMLGTAILAVILAIGRAMLPCLLYTSPSPRDRG